MDKLFSSIQQSLQNSNLTNTNPNVSNLLQSQQMNQDTINELLNKSAEALMCGPDCQKQKITDELRQKYLDAETNMQTAPIKLEQSKKNYYIYTEGRPYYNNMLEDELTKKADKISEALTQNFNEELTTANTMNSYLNTALINSENTKELLKHYVSLNKELKLKLRDRHGDILTNDRKTYYETDALDRLKLWYKFLWYIYYLLVLVLIIASFVSPSQLTTVKKMILILIFVFYPYYIDYIIRWIHGLYISIYNRLPKNIYNNL